MASTSEQDRPERAQVEVEATLQGKFMEFGGVRFPALPSGSYSSSLDGHARAAIESRSGTELPTHLCLGWAMVLALYTSSSDVLFGLLDDRGGDGKGRDSTVPCHLVLNPEDAVQTAAGMVDQYRGVSRYFERLGLDRLRTTSMEATRICDFHNVLVIHPLDESEGENAVLSGRNNWDYPLVVYCGIHQRRITVNAMFDSAVMRSELVQSMVDQFAFTLNQLANSPNARLRDIQDINPQDLKKHIEWNRPYRKERCNKCVHHLFEQHCIERPTAPAVCAWDGELSYDELDRRASCLARQLVSAGVGPDKLVFILAGKSSWIPVSILGILKAGGGFALLNPSQPTHRLVTMCNVASPRLILASRQYAAKASLLGPPVVVMEDMKKPDSLEMAPDNYFRSPCKAEGHHALYVTFTSGSTGAPKGVLMEHGAFTSGYDIPGLSRESRVLHFASFDFVACIIEHFLALTRGACLCIPSEDQLENNMEEAIGLLRPTWALLTPSVARIINPKSVPSIETLFLTGEAITQSEFDRWGGHVALHAMYGQSEHSLAIMITPLSGLEDLSTVGYPGTATAWIVDPTDHNRLMPPGVDGELVLQGPCLARGYVNNEEQTRKTFITDPAWMAKVGIEKPNRFLKTGDIFCRSPVDGSFQFRGRNGRRVKIRGQRVELSEVEYHTAVQFPEAPNVCAEIIHPSDDDNGDDAHSGMLVAAIPTGSKGEAQIDSCQLVAPDATFLHRVQHALEKLRKVLPTYMIPSSFIPVVSLPRTPSGKLHRKLLVETISRLTRDEILAYMTAPRAYRAPATENEVILQRAIAKVLSQQPARVGMDDHFLGLGGDSLSARQLVSVARAEGLSIKVADCFQQPNVAALAQCAVEACHSLPSESVPASTDLDPFHSLREDFLNNLPGDLTASMVEDIVPTREMQLFLVEYNIMDYVPIRISGDLDPIQLRRACENLVKNHTMLRTIFVPFQDEYVQVVLRNMEVPWEASTGIPDGHDPDMWAHSVCAADREKTSSQKDEPMVKFILLQDDRLRHHTLIMRLSHSQFDGLCLEPILTDLAKLYEDKPLNIQASYSDYVRKCARLRTKESLSFWKELLHGSTPTNLPLTPSMDQHQQAQCVVASQDLPTTVPPPSGFTWATVVKAAWSYILQHKTGNDDLVFTQITNCRYVGAPEYEKVLGPCLNPIPVRVKYSDTLTVRELLNAVQSQHIASLDHHTLEWKDIVLNCTQWDKDTDIDSIVLHENLDTNPATRVGSAVWRVLAHSVDNPPERTVYLYTYPQQGSLYVVLILSSEFGGKSDAESLVELFCSTVTSFITAPDMPLSSL